MITTYWHRQGLLIIVIPCVKKKNCDSYIYNITIFIVSYRYIYVELCIVWVEGMNLLNHH